MSTRIPLIAADEQKRSLNERLEMSTAEIGLSVRTTNCLEDRGIFTVHDLLNCTRADLLSISNFGEKTLEEVYAALENVGFYRKGRAPRGDQAVSVRRPRATSARLRPDLHAD
jgi:DNA-directed RNA polymerase subunit alpha